MLTPETARQFRERGLRLIEPREGRDFLWHELLYGARGRGGGRGRGASLGRTGGRGRAAASQGTATIEQVAA